ncbi:glycosyltransferase [Algibacter sp. AS12]|uniref:glycosyltransferase n=1 Tax=Algibacter sp. AS12 TaxID=3135773 RepID=UPI00398ADD1A
MLKKPLLSIIITCYNDAEFVEQSVNSALNQSYSNKEVIVVDDGSDDETKQVLIKLENKITKLIVQDNNGQSSARNAGINRANGDYILILDSDDFFESLFCEKAIDVFLKNKEVKIVTCYANLLFNNGSTHIFKPKGGDIKDFICLNGALGTSMFKKSDWNSVKGYDENMRSGFEDWEFFIRVLQNGGTTHVIKEPLFNYRKRLNTTTAKANKIKYDLIKYIYLKHKDLYVKYNDLFVFHLLRKLEQEEKEKIKNTLRKEFVIGRSILSPFRIFKKLFK